MLRQKPPVTIYTDGSGHQGTGGYGFIILYPDREVHGYGGAINTTVNQMEQLAAVMALQCLDYIEGIQCRECGGIRQRTLDGSYNYPSSCDKVCKERNDYSPARLIGAQDCKIISDSQYLIKGMNTHLYKWEIDEFKNFENEYILNSYMWNLLSKLSRVHSPEWQWVKGHSGVKYNEKADKLATKGRLKAKEYISSLQSQEKQKSTIAIFDLEQVRYTPYKEISLNTIDSFIVSGKLRLETIYTEPRLI